MNRARQGFRDAAHVGSIFGSPWWCAVSHRVHGDRARPAHTLHLGDASIVITLLVNPASGDGRGAALANEVERALGAYGTVRRVETSRRGDERRLAREACTNGTRTLAVVGGDGSVHHAAHGVLEGGAALPLAIFAAGSGNDFVKSLGTPSHDVGAMAALVGRGQSRRIDVGYIDDRPFVNAAGFGFDVEVLERMQGPSLFRGTAHYVTTALRALCGYRGFRCALADGTSAERANTHRRLLTVIANGRCFGGAFQIAPTAVLDDGLLDIVDIADVSPWARAPLFWRATRGTHLGTPLVSHVRGLRFTLEFDEPPRFEMDGELTHATARVVAVRIQRGALSVIC